MCHSGMQPLLRASPRTSPIRAAIFPSLDPASRSPPCLRSCLHCLYTEARVLFLKWNLDPIIHLFRSAGGSHCIPARKTRPLSPYLPPSSTKFPLLPLFLESGNLHPSSGHSHLLLPQPGMLSPQTSPGWPILSTQVSVHYHFSREIFSGSHTSHPPPAPAPVLSPARL